MSTVPRNARAFSQSVLRLPLEPDGLRAPLPARALATTFLELVELPAEAGRFEAATDTS
jgi:hypothetical protein